MARDLHEKWDADDGSRVSSISLKRGGSQLAASYGPRGLIQKLAHKTDAHVSDVKGMIIWGNHSATQYPDVSHANVSGKPARELVDGSWLSDEFIPVVQQRGAATGEDVDTGHGRWLVVLEKYRGIFQL